MKIEIFLLLLLLFIKSILMQQSIIFTDFSGGNQTSSSITVKRIQIGSSLYRSFNDIGYFDASSNSSIATSSSTLSFILSIQKNFNYTINSFESKTNYFTSIELNDIFSLKDDNLTTIVNNRIVLTHTSFDCDDYVINSLNLNNNTTSNSNSSSIPIIVQQKIYCLSTSINQLVSVVKSFLNNYQYTYYSIIYSDINENNLQYLDYYRHLADELVFTLTLESFKLHFSISSTNPFLFDKLKSTPAKVIILLMDCGTEIEFFQRYKTSIPDTVVYLSVYNSPKCVSLVNTYNDQQYLNDTVFKNVYKNLFKIIPIDILNDNNNNNNYANFVNLNSTTTTSIIDLKSYQNLINENEDYSIMNSLIASSGSMNNINNMTFNCYFINTKSQQLCQRSFNFYLINLNIANNLFQDAIKFTLDLPLLVQNTSNVKQALILNTNGILWPNGKKIAEATSCYSIKSDVYEEVLYFIGGLALLALIFAIVAYFIRNRMARKQMSIGPNKILLLPEDLEFVAPKSSIFQSRLNIRGRDAKSQTSLRSETDLVGTKMAAKYKGDLVFVKRLKIPNFQVKNRTMKELKLIRDLRHENLNPFIGCYTDPKIPALIFEYATRGSLEDIIMKQEIKLDWNFKWSMLNDLCRGMRYLHHSPIKYHGNLKSRNCVVDSRWVCKITDYGLPFIYSSQSFSRTLDLSDLLWTAPEHLRECTIRDQVIISVGSQAGDIYSFGIIMQEIILRGAPFCMLELTHEEIINKIRKPPPLLRPSVSKQAAPPEYINIMKQCWTEQPEMRCSFDELCQQFKVLNGGKKINIVDMMFKMLEQYSNNLEDAIKDRTLQLEEEKKKTEKLLAEMLPRTVAESLITGQPVPPESFDCVTIYFSDIVGFTTISAYSSPIEVVQLLNDLYTMFDSILTDFDVYKVETIGDAYMVVSGLPDRNGNQHAGEIATMALTLLHHCAKFQIKHLPGIPLRVRIGMHSGACVSGVVGLTMPRYCLFGDTVNTASRMESTSTAYRIHVSQATAEILEVIGGYKLEYRGETELKGKGIHKTYWLVGKEGFNKSLPKPVDSDANHGFDAELIKTLERIRREQLEKLELEAIAAAAEKELNDAGGGGENSKTIITENQQLSNSKSSNKINKNDSGFSEITNNSLNIPNNNTNHLINDETTAKLEQINELKRNSIALNNTTKLPINLNGKVKRLTDVESIA